MYYFYFFLSIFRIFSLSFDFHNVTPMCLDVNLDFPYLGYARFTEIVGFCVSQIGGSHDIIFWSIFAALLSLSFLLLWNKCFYSSLYLQCSNYFCSNILSLLFKLVQIFFDSSLIINLFHLLSCWTHPRFLKISACYINLLWNAHYFVFLASKSLLKLSDSLLQLSISIIDFCIFLIFSYSLSFLK
jgi:hypothetical protein